MQHVRVLVLTAILLTFGSVLAASEVTAQEAKLPRVGMLLLGGPGPRYNGLRDDLAKLGYVEGKNVIFEPRFARGQFDRTPALAAELVAANVRARRLT